MQIIHVVVDDTIHAVNLPTAEARTPCGGQWGDASFLLTPAWIAKHAHMRWLQGAYDDILQPGAATLAEDAVFCLLGGYGVKAEVAAAAFGRLRDSGLFEGKLDKDAIERELKRPLSLPCGRSVRYRFPNIRADYIDSALARLSGETLPKGHVKLRDWLMSIRGVGAKTASFIVRNHFGSNDVAILDIHVLRAGRIARIFPSRLDVGRHYQILERYFLDFAQASGVPASILDIALWDMMRRIPKQRLRAADEFNRQLESIAACEAPRYDSVDSTTTNSIASDFSWAAAATDPGFMKTDGPQVPLKKARKATRRVRVAAQA